MNRTTAYLVMDFLAIFLLMMVGVVVLKAVFPDLGVWILVVVGGLVGLLYPLLLRGLREAGEP